MISADAIRGHIDLIVLAILEPEPSYPYAISQAIEDGSGGEYSMKQTTLYTAMKRLEQQGALHSFNQVADSGKNRSYYELTDEGRDLLATKREEWAQVSRLIDRYVTGRTQR